MWNKKQLGDRRATAALGAGISAALLSSTRASPLRDRDIKLRSLWFMLKGQEQLFKGKLNGERSGEGLCGLSARLLIPWGGHGVGMKSHQHEHRSSYRATGRLQSHRRAFPQGPGPPDTGPAPGFLCSAPPKPTTGTEPPPRRGAVGQGRLNTAPASGFLRDKPLRALPRLTPSKSDFA